MNSCRHGLIMRQSQAVKDVNMEAKDYPLLGAITKQ
jgi:hypothetical protein